MKLSGLMAAASPGLTLEHRAMVRLGVRRVPRICANVRRATTTVTVGSRRTQTYDSVCVRTGICTWSCHHSREADL